MHVLGGEPFQKRSEEAGKETRTVWHLANGSIIESLELLQPDVSGEQQPAKATWEQELPAAGPRPSEQKSGIIMGQEMA